MYAYKEIFHNSAVRKARNLLTASPLTVDREGRVSSQGGGWMLTVFVFLSRSTTPTPWGGGGRERCSSFGLGGSSFVLGVGEGMVGGLDCKLNGFGMGVGGVLLLATKAPLPINRKDPKDKNMAL